MTARIHRIALLLMLLSLVLAACGGGDGGDTGADADAGSEPAAGTSEAAQGTEAAGVPGGAADLVIWADDIRVPVMRELGEQFGSDQGVTVEVQEVAFEDIRGQLQQAGPAGEGPDLIVGANDWVGELVTNGAIAPIDLPNTGDFNEVTIESFSWEGQLYGVPFAVENLALFRNTDLAPDAPETFQDVVDTSLQLQEDGEVDQAFMIPSSPEEAPYHYFPIQTAFGGYYFGLTDEGYDTSDVGIDNQGSIAAGQAVRGWVEDGFINPDVTGQIQQEQFGAGEVAYAISGPWALQQGGAGFEETGVPFEVTPIPAIEGGEPQPFVGSQGVMVSAFAENGLLAQTFATDVMASEEAQLSMFEANARPPALTSALEQIEGDNPAIAAFFEAGQNGQPLPAVPAMSSVFTAMGDAWTLIFTGDSSPEEALGNAAQTVNNAVGN